MPKGYSDAFGVAAAFGFHDTGQHYHGSSSRETTALGYDWHCP